MIMFEKKVVLYDDFLQAGQKKIYWDQIIGIRIFDGELLRKVSNRIPRAELFLKHGKVITISNLNKFQNLSSLLESQGPSDYENVMSVVKNKAANLNPIFSHWIEWRIILPVLLFEFLTLSVCLIMKISFLQIIYTMLFAGILGAILGLFWEKNARKRVGPKNGVAS